ncbi:MAG: hypothetical protein HXX16_12850 [Bacteroidales bacterium]|nr:hypothetical protein [Bacteroidales bacterium]
MQITELVWNLFLLLLPGVISTLMVRYITTHKQYTIFEFVIYSAVLGIGTFIIMELFCSLGCIILGIFCKSVTIKFGLNLSIWDNLFNGQKTLNKGEIFFSYLLSIPIGFFWGFLLSKKIIIRIFQKWKLTSRYGDDDVWSFFLNSPNTEWIYLHHKKTNLTYFGKIRSYSDSTEKREILIEDVIVYESDTWTEKYQSNAVYLELNNFEFTIELPKFLENETDANS